MSARAQQRSALQIAEAQHRLELASLLDALVQGPEKVSASGPLQVSLQKNSHQTLSQAFKDMSPEYRDQLHRALGEEALSQLVSLSEETDAEFFFRQILHWASSLENENKISAAALTYQWVKSVSQPYGTEKKIDSFALGAEAERRLQILQGAGSLGLRFEFIGRRFLDQTMDPAMLAGFGIAGILGKGLRLKVLSELLALPTESALTRGVLPQLVASGAGLMLEAPAFVVTVKAGHEAMGLTEDWSASQMAKEVLSNGITLLMLRGCGALSEKAFNGLHGIDPLLGTAQRLNAFTRLTQKLFPQGGMLAGIMFSHELEARLGLRPRVEGSHPLAEGLITLLQFNIAGDLGGRLMGTRFRAWERELDVLARHLSPRPFGLFGPVQELDTGLGIGPTILLSENHDDSGSGSNKVLKLYPTGSEAPKDLENEAPPAKNSESLPSLEEIRRLGELVQKDTKNLWDGLRTDLRDLWMQSRVWLGHLELGRGEAIEISYSAGHLRRLVEQTRQKLDLIDPMLKNLEALTFTTRSDPATHSEIREKRDQMKNLEGQTRGLVKILENFDQQFQKPAAQELRRLNLSLASWMGRWLEIQALVSPAKFPTPHDQLLLDKAQGMLLGTMIRELYRPRPEEKAGKSALLSSASERATDSRHLGRLLYDLAHADPRSDYFDLLLRPESSRLGPRLREILRHGGTVNHPTQTWFNVQIPALLAANEGSFEVTMRKIEAIKPLFSKEQLVATEMAAWWLSKAMLGTGSPASWVKEYRADSSLEADGKDLVAGVFDWIQRNGKPEEFAAIVAGDGELGAVSFSIYQFLQHSFDPTLALNYALRAPEALREDVVGLTGALIGAFHGDGIFPPSWMRRSLLGNLHPQNDAATMIARLEAHHSQHLDLNRAFQTLPEIWAEGREPRVTRPRLYAMKAAGTEVEAPVFEREYRLAKESAEVAIQEWEKFLKRGGREGFTPHEIQYWVSQRGEFLSKLETALRNLRQFYPEPSEEAQGFSAELAVNSLGRVLNLFRSANSLLAVYRRGTAVQHLSPEDALTFKEILIAMRAALGVPTPPTVPPASLNFNELDIRRLYETQEGWGKSLRPPRLAVPLFEKRSDWAMSQAIQRGFLEIPPFSARSKMMGVEELAGLYFEIMGKPTARIPNRSLTEEISMSAMLSVITPAFLKIHGSDPSLAYRMIKGMNSQRAPKIGDAWRAVTYLNLRLLDGASPNAELLRDAAQALGPKSAMANRLYQVADWVEKSPDFSELSLHKWNSSSDPRDQASLGILSFFQQPHAKEKALDAASRRRYSQDSEYLAARVTALLLGSVREASSVATAKPSAPSLAKAVPRDPKADAKVVSWKSLTERRAAKNSGTEVAMKSEDADALKEWFDPQSHEGMIHEGILTWAGRKGEKLTLLQLRELHQRVDAFPPYFRQHLAYYAKSDPESFKFLCFSLGIVPLEKAGSLGVEFEVNFFGKSRDILSKVEFESQSKEILDRFEMFAGAYFPKVYQPLDLAGQGTFREKLGNLPPQALKVLNDTLLGRAQFFLLLNEWGVSSLGIPLHSEIPE